MNRDLLEDDNVLVLGPLGGAGNRLVVREIPDWVACWFGKTPAELHGQSVTEVIGAIIPKLSALAHDVFESGRTVESFGLEFIDNRGKERAVIVDARRERASRPTTDDRRPTTQVILRLEDVTDALQSRREEVRRKSYCGIIGDSPAMLRVFQKIDLYGPADGSVVITGETGTGKELVARALHQRSPRRLRPFVAVNCCALSEELFESELFGHEKGSFTGASRTHKGRFERAHEGSLFLDEIGDMAPRIQSKLLRVLEESRLERVGGEKEIPVDVRVIAATNISLDAAVALGRFRADLFHRLTVFRIHVPPLRDRVVDIPLIVEHLLEIFSERYNRRIERVSPEAMKALTEYNWPGNIRELRNVIERLVVETRGNVIGRKALEMWEEERELFMPGGWSVQSLDAMRLQTQPVIPPWVREQQALPAPGQGIVDPSQTVYGGMGVPIDAVYQVVPTSRQKPPELTQEVILDAVRETDGNITQAARNLGVHKATLYRRMKDLGLTREDL